MDGGKATQCSTMEDLVVMAGGKSDIHYLLSDREMSYDVVAVLIVRDKVFHAIGEGSVFNVQLQALRWRAAW
jgi:hypothetical protein